MRELEHLLSRAALKARSEVQDDTVILQRRHLDLDPVRDEAPTSSPATTIDSRQADLAMKDAMDEFQRNLIIQRLERHEGDMAAAARSLELNRSNFYRLLQRLQLR